MNKDGKGVSRSTVAFGVADMTMLADGSWAGTIRNMNGDPNRSMRASMPAGITYHGGTEVPVSPASIAVYLPDGATVDLTKLFPWGAGQENPLRLGGGHIKGNIHEGMQRNSADTGPVQAPFVVSEWVDGTAFQISAYVADPKGQKFMENDEIFAFIAPNAEGNWIVKDWARKEGTALDMGTPAGA